MNWLQKLARPEIWELAPYSSARQEMQDTDGMVQLDANENPYMPYPQNLVGANRYPSPQPTNLINKLAAIYATRPEQLLVARGMDEIIDLLIRTFCIPYQDSILITPPTFGYYQVAAELSAIQLVRVDYELNNKKFNLNIDTLIASCHEKVKIVFLCTPNNPTGNSLNLKYIEKLVSCLPNVIVAIDEAYIEFSEFDSATDLIDKYQNLVVMRTLSKAYAFAGIRIGTMIARTELKELVAKVLAPYPLPLPCVNLALQMLSPHGMNLTHSRIELLKLERQRMYEKLSLVSDITVFPSQGNFLLIKVNNAAKLYNDLIAKGIIVRNRSKDVADSLRITIGTPTENNLVLAAFGFKEAIEISADRVAVVNRKTNETDILIQVNLDRSEPIKISTGIGFFDHMLEQLAKHGGFSLEISAKGDTHIDYHHTVEDVAIVLGSALRKALGDKRGVARYGFVLPMDESRAFATIDLSGRGTLELEANFPTPMIGDFPIEMVEHFFLSLAHNLGASIHLQATGSNSHHMVEGLFKACAKVFAQAIKLESNDLPTTKGIL